MFKNIIIGIDFSECSQNALQHAVSMAVNFKADLTLVHVISPDEKLVVESKENSDIITFAQERLEQYASQCRLVVTENEVRTKIRMGKPEREINAEANLLGDALITMGTHGCSGFEEFFVGSNTYKVVSRANCPVLTIRKDVDIHRDLTDISLVFDDTRETLQKLKTAAIFAKAFQAKVHVTGLYTKSPNINNVISGYLANAEDYLMERNIRFDTNRSENVRTIDGLFEQAKLVNANMIIIMREVELATENMFKLGHVSERIVNRSPIPVLVVPVDKSIYAV